MTIIKPDWKYEGEVKEGTTKTHGYGTLYYKRYYPYIYSIVVLNITVTLKTTNSTATESSSGKVEIPTKANSEMTRLMA